MTRDQLEMLFGLESPLVVVGLWLGSFVALLGLLALVVTFAKKLWPGVAQFVNVLVLVSHLGNRLAAIESTLTDLGALLERVRGQVENDHDTNLREESDERHSQLVDMIRGVQKDVGRLDQRDIENGKDRRRTNDKIDALNKQVAEALGRARDAEERIEDLEDTANLIKE